MNAIENQWLLVLKTKKPVNHNEPFESDNKTAEIEIDLELSM
jgi:hypothetical protein